MREKIREKLLFPTPTEFGRKMDKLHLPWCCYFNLLFSLRNCVGRMCKNYILKHITCEMKFVSYLERRAIIQFLLPVFLNYYVSLIFTQFSWWNCHALWKKSMALGMSEKWSWNSAHWCFFIREKLNSIKLSEPNGSREQLDFNWVLARLLAVLDSCFHQAKSCNLIDTLKFF